MGFFFIVHIIVCVLLVSVILFQDGKAGGLTSVSDSSQSVFGAKGAASFLTKLTSTLAIGFMCTSLFLNFTGASSDKSIADGYVPTEVSTPDDSTVKSPENDENSPETEEFTPADAAAGASEGEKTATEEGDEATPAEKKDDESGEQ